MEQEEIKKAFVNLRSLKDNLPKSLSINEKFVRMFHNEINRLVAIGFSGLDDFKVPENEIKHEMTSFTPAAPEFGQQESISYSQDRYIEREILLIKIDALLAYFQVSSTEVEIGFKLD